MKKPVIAIPIGDPAGVGPEIVAKSIASDEVFQIAVCVIVGDRKIVEKAIEITGENLKINEIKEPEEAVDEKGVLNLINLDNVDMDTFAYGKVSAMCGKAAYEYIAKSIELANAGKVDAVATTPINKESLHAAEVPYIGHTEIFGALTHTEDPLTMFETNGMRVFFLTRHVSLRQMLDMIKKDRIIDYVKRCTKALERLGVKEGTMAIAGLNPHSGEHGLFGWEEVEEIMPAIEELKRRMHLQTNYFLYLGTLEPRKNLDRLIRAYALLKQQHPDAPQLVLAGGYGWRNNHIYQLVQTLHLEDDVLFTEYVPEEDVQPLLCGAMAFVFPSVYEGFGMPPLEAMACGTPVLTTRAASLPEVVGDAAVIVDPHHTEDIAQGLEKLFLDAALRERLQKEGLRRAAMFSWENAAAALYDVYQEALTR